MNTKDIESMVELVWNDALAKFGSARLGKTVPKVTFFDKGRVAGVANAKEHRVSFHTVLAARAGDSFFDVVAHEVAHIVTRRLYPQARQSHGPEFRYVCCRLGGSGKTRHTIDTTGLRLKTVTRHVLKCEACNYEYQVTHQKLKKIESLPKMLCGCTKCGVFGRLVKNGTVKYS